MFSILNLAIVFLIATSCVDVQEQEISPLEFSKQNAQTKYSYEDIKSQILISKCLNCHGPSHAINLSLSQKELIQKGYVIPGKPIESPLFYRLKNAGAKPDKETMPLNQALEADEINKISVWIKSLKTSSLPDEVVESPPPENNNSEDNENSPPSTVDFQTLELSFNNVKEHILKNNCLNCHSAQGSASHSNFDVTDYNDLVTQGYITKGKPAESPLLYRIKDAQLKPNLENMPITGETLTVEEIDYMKRWISSLKTESPSQPNQPVPKTASYVIELEDFDTNSFWEKCSQNIQCESNQNNYSGHGHLITKESAAPTIAESEIVGKVTIQKGGTYHLWAMSARTGQQRQWGFKIGSFTSQDIGTQNTFELVGSMTLEAKEYNLIIQDRSPDAYWSYPDAIFLTQESQFDLSKATSATTLKIYHPDEILSPKVISRYSCQETDINSKPANDIKRLTRIEYINTLTDLFGTELVNKEVIQTQLSLFPNDYDQGKRIPKTVNQNLLETTLAVAQELASFLGNDSSLRSRVFKTTCTQDLNLSDNCFDELFNNFFEKVYRRTLASEHKNKLRTIFSATQGDNIAKFKSMIIYALNTPHFFYHLELYGKDIEQRDDYFEIDQFSLASRLSYSLWGSMPDEELLTAAKNNQLIGYSNLKTQVQRMLSSEKAQNFLKRFYKDWFEIDQIENFSFKSYFLGNVSTQNLKESMIKELEDFLHYITWEQKQGFQELLTSETTYINDLNLAKVYGKSQTGKVSLNTSQRAGLLGKGIILARNAHRNTSVPIHRGAYILEKLFCSVPPAPNPADFEDGELDPVFNEHEHLSTRQIVQNKTSAPACIGCHAKINPAGFVLEGYDAIGRFRNFEKKYDENGNIITQIPIDTNVSLDIQGKTIAASSAVDFATKVSKISAGYDCMAKTYREYTMKRQIASVDSCAIKKMSNHLVGDETIQGSIIKMIEQNALDETQRFRKIGR
ncbi:MAG: DUF1592 domain-containing protein [Bacteriovoracaceae bacterium]|jgi:hypothetical protein|nr:hypothetical protein [Halobacteriovoraceae bacterium]MDP7320594.1 DUF1592 domain-containing protein [Bacteriovoracaceae bacterium]